MTMLQHGLVPSTGGYQIERSLRFNSADSAHLSQTPANTGNRRTFTWSCWFKRADLGSATSPLFTAGASITDAFDIIFLGNDKLQVQRVTGTTYYYNRSTQVFRDPSAWYHIVVAVDTTQATAGDRVRVYINGSEITAWDNDVAPPQNHDYPVNTASYPGRIGRTTGDHSTSYYMSGYMADAYFIDGSAKTPSDFGENDTDTGVWKPKAYTGSYGTNGFKLTFSDNSGTTSTTLGKDTSGNGNNWTPNNFSVTAGAGNDSLVDTPTPYGTDTGAGGEVRGNYCTLNPLNTNSSTTLSNGNLNLVTPSSGYGMTYSNFGMSSGKWYWEATIVSNSGGADIGINKSDVSLSQYMGQGANSWAYLSNAYKRNNNSASSYGASFTDNDVIGVALDLDAGTLVFYKNGSSQGTAYSSLSGEFFPAFSDDSNGAGVSIAVNFGQRPFAYTAPSGFKALCTTNLPTPTIGATSSTRADDYFNAVLYTGDGTTPRSITVGFQPDFVWHKPRTTTGDHQLFDAVRGAGKGLYTNGTFAEYDYGTGSTSPFISFDSNGYTIGTGANSNTAPYVSWNWKANGAGSSNTAGSITSTVSANTTAGFSIVTYTGNGSNSTVGHGLGVAPQMIIVKGRSNTYGWVVWHQSIYNANSSNYLVLSSTAAAGADSSYFTTTAPTSSVFSLGTGVASNQSSQTFVAYCFAPVAGYSAFGSYTGNGSADGPFVYLGFRPKFVLFKLTSGADSWMIYDAVRNTYNVVNNQLYPNSSSAEYAADSRWYADFLSNGFKLRGTDALLNGNGSTYIYAAFAENPFKYSLAR